MSVQITQEHFVHSQTTVPSAEDSPQVVRGCQTDVDPVCSTGKWCDFDVRVYNMNWDHLARTLLDVWRSEESVDNAPLPVGKHCTVMLADTVEAVKQGVDLLKLSMQDPVVAIDLEWKPEKHSSDLHDVALMQLATASFCLLIRICKIGLTPPPKLLDFLRDGDVVLVGQGWGSADEQKLQYTWGLGKADFGRMIDNEHVARQLGYVKVGLANMAALLMGFRLRKSSSLTMTNWEAAVLPSSALQYACLDALVSGHLFRELRRIHAQRLQSAGTPSAIASTSFDT